MQANNDIPTFTTQEERYMLWSRAGDDPFVAIRNAQRGFLFIYEMKPTGSILNNEAVQSIRNIAKPYRLDIGPDSQVELIGGEVGPHSGTICCKNEEDARVLGGEVRDIIEDEANWE